MSLPPAPQGLPPPPKRTVAPPGSFVDSSATAAPTHPMAAEPAKSSAPPPPVAKAPPPPPSGAPPPPAAKAPPPPPSGAPPPPAAKAPPPPPSGAPPPPAAKAPPPPPSGAPPPPAAKAPPPPPSGAPPPPAAKAPPPAPTTTAKSSTTPASSSSSSSTAAGIGGKAALFQELQQKKPVTASATSTTALKPVSSSTTTATTSASKPVTTSSTATPSKTVEKPKTEEKSKTEEKPKTQDAPPPQVASSSSNNNNNNNNNATSPASPTTLSMSPLDQVHHFELRETTARNIISGEERDAIMWMYVAWQSLMTRIMDLSRVLHQKLSSFESQEAEERSRVVMQEAVASSSMFAVAVATPLMVVMASSPRSSSPPTSPKYLKRSGGVGGNNNNDNDNASSSSPGASSGFSGGCIPAAVVTEYLTSLGLVDYADAFCEHGFNDVESLSQVAPEDLIEMGCFSVGERRKILSRINGVNSTTGSPLKLNVNNNNNNNNNNSPTNSSQQQQSPFESASVASTAGCSSWNPSSPMRTASPAVNNLNITNMRTQTYLTTKPLSWSQNINTSPSSTTSVVEQTFSEMHSTLREDDMLLQRDWTNLRCRPTPGRPDEDDKWEAKWRVACRTDLVQEGQWEREARSTLTRIQAAGRGNDQQAVAEIPFPPIAHRSENGGLVLLSETGNIGTSSGNNTNINTRSLVSARQKLIQRRWLGLSCN